MATDKNDVIIASGGFIAPSSVYADFRKPFKITYRVRNPLRRWWFRRTGWSTEWTVEYDPGEHLIKDALPSFTAIRGGIETKHGEPV